MYCQRCGKENTDTSKFCIQCGTPLRNVEHIPETSNGVLDYTKSQTKNKNLFIILRILSAIGVFIPFTKWVEIPADQTLYNTFKILSKVYFSRDISLASLFGFLDVRNINGMSKEFMIISWVFITFMMIIPPIFYTIFIIMTFNKNKKCFSFSMIASVVGLIDTILVVVFINLMPTIDTFIFNVQTTNMPIFNFLISITNIILTAIVRKKHKNHP